VRVFGLDLGHPLVAAMSFTPYVAATAPLPLLVAIALRQWAVAGLAAAALIAFAVVILPRAVDGPHHASDADGGPTLVVMTANLQYGRGDAATIMRLVRENRVDVLSLQELTPEAVQRLSAAGARERFPGFRIDPRPGASGSGLLVDRPARPAGPRDVTGAAQPELEFTVPGWGPLRVKTAHPPPPISGEAVRRWRHELGEMPSAMQDGVPHLLAGDFNGTLDHHEVRRLIGRGYFDAAGATGDGLHATWPVGRRRPGLVLDHVLLPDELRVRRVSIHEVAGSDHRAVIAEVVLPVR
jgi:endonuclease/exonuclease/phosphatase (EEP) superfamily protein YafD